MDWTERLAAPTGGGYTFSEGQRPYAICLLGPPASGKGTTARLISSLWSLPIICPGDIYKELREQDTELGRRVREALKDGGYCPNELTNQIMTEETQSRLAGGARGVLLDGFPRNAEQLGFLDSRYRVGMYLHLTSDYDTLLRAALGRRECPECHHISNEALATARCDCDTSVMIRWDDTPKMYQKRWATYQRLTQPIIDAVSSRPNYVKMDVLRKRWGLDSMIDLWKPFIGQGCVEF